MIQNKKNNFKIFQYPATIRDSTYFRWFCKELGYDDLHASTFPYFLKDAKKSNMIELINDKSGWECCAR